MLAQAIGVAILGFAVVFLTLFILTLSVKAMSGVMKKTVQKGGK